MKTENIEKLRARLIKDAEKLKTIKLPTPTSLDTLDMFVPLVENNMFYIDKHRDDFDYVNQKEILELMRKMNHIRQALWHSNLRRPYRDCTVEEIADDKIKIVIKLVDERPDLEEIIEDLCK